MKRVLIIDDDMMDASFMRVSLEAETANAKLAVTIENDSSKALDTCHSLEPDLVCIDIHMPPPDGFELLTMLSMHASRPDFRLVILSGSTSDHDRVKAMELGADDYQIKPATIEGYHRLAQLLLNSHVLPARADLQAS